MTLNVKISDDEFKRFGFTKRELTFAELLDLVSRKKAADALQESARIAEGIGLSGMTMDEIDEEIQAARRDAKNRR